MVASTQERMSPTVSTATLDLQDVLSSFNGDCLVSLRLSISASDSIHSFDNIPPFPTKPNPVAFVSDFKNKCQPSRGTHRPSGDVRSIVTLPTAPRRKAMLTEKIDIHAWKVSVTPPSEPPTRSARDAVDVSLVDTSPHSHSSTSASTLAGVAPSDPSRCIDTTSPLLVPTIMVSNSTTALSVSFDSPQNPRNETSLAVRRGRKPLPALSLMTVTKSDHSSADRDPYPDIPSAFLGSPTCSSPTFSFSTGDPSKYNMGLSAMCNSLRALVPSLPFSPLQSTAPPRPKLEPETRWGVVSSMQLPDVDDDEWAFAQDLVIEWHASRGLRAEVSPPPSPPGELPYAADTSPSAVVSVTMHSLVSSPSSTMVDRPTKDKDKDNGTDEPTSPDVKQMRRKTVIIQAPELDETCGHVLEKLRKMDNVTAAADWTIDLLPGEFDEPVPFETPAYIPLAAPVLADGRASNLRPCSTTSSAKVPVRGILKGKKSVRFSSVPSLHEYEKDDNTDEDDDSERDDIHCRPATPSPSIPIKPNPEPKAPTSGRRPPLITTPRKSSPLREHSSPGSDSTNNMVVVAAAASRAATMPFAPTPASVPGNTMARHPAVRALAHRPQAPRPTGSPRLMGSGFGGAVVGAPGLQSPTPVYLEAQRRAPLKSINMRQSLPKERKPDVLIPVKAALVPSRRSLAPPTPTPTSAPASTPPATVDRRNVRTASVPVSAAAAQRPVHERDDSARRRSEGVVGRGDARRGSGEDACGGGIPTGAAGAGQRGSRMPVPLRSIFSKLRT
ncbi:hypothetical protein C8Q74DRAFT_1405253 [Fomes fomentarius]|nr:hypothetical protein C8Q74DRAFT_1405253 [Fomes fomentarius]